MAGEQRIIRFRGNVQGVGFRYTAVQTAYGYDVTGCVRNLPDGSVECVVEGETGEVSAFVTELCERMGGHVRQKTEQTAPPSGAFRTFDVKF